MSWELHRYAVERARDRMRERLAELEKENGGPIGVMVPLMAGHEDAEMLDEVADFLMRRDEEKPTPWTGNEFADDWNNAIGTLSNFASKYDLPKPDLIFHPRWHAAINRACDMPILGTLIARGIRARFGRWEQRDTLVP